jgi:hypothetical protein
MSREDPPTPQEFKLSDHEIEGLESFDDQPSPEQAEPAPPATPNPPPSAPLPPPQAASSRSSPRPGRQRRSFSVFWPMILIMGGALLLLQELGYVSGLSWGNLWRLWPLLLVALGIDTLFARRSTAGAFFSALLILALLGGAVYVVMNASDFPWMSQFVQESGWQSERIAHPLAGVDRARVLIDWASVPLRLDALEDSPNLIEGTVVYRGRLDFDVSGGRRPTVLVSSTSLGAGWSPAIWTESADLDDGGRRWVLGLSPRAPIELELNGGSGAGVLDLRGLDLRALELDVASGGVDLYLPGDASAQGDYEAEIKGGSGSLDLYLPPRAGVRLEVDGGSGTFLPGERLNLVSGEHDGDGVWETTSARSADSILVIRLDVASGTVRVRDWE